MKSYLTVVANDDAAATKIEVACRDAQGVWTYWPSGILTFEIWFTDDADGRIARLAFKHASGGNWVAIEPGSP